MLFNFFEKHEKQNAVREHLGRFQDAFTYDQKKAILLSLFLIANADGEFHNREVDFLEQTSLLLGYDYHDGTFEEFMSMGKAGLYKLLRSLNESQKDWYIITVYGMVHADGRAFEREYQFMEVFLYKMGITESRFIGVLEKADLLARKFR